MADDFGVAPDLGIALPISGLGLSQDEPFGLEPHA